MNTIGTYTTLSSSYSSSSVMFAQTAPAITASDDAQTSSKASMSSGVVDVISDTARKLSKSSGTSIVGHSLMVSRIFGGHEPAVADGTQGYSKENIGRPGYAYLTQSDRALVADMYAYAQEQGADLSYVDALALQLGSYRQQNNGSIMANYNNTPSYDTEGHRLTVDFNDRDAAAAQSILDGTAINSTRVDQGFLRFITDPGHGALQNASSMEFLAQMVVKFSGEGADVTLGSEFSTYTPFNIKDNVVLHVSEDVQWVSTEPDIVTINGQHFVTDTGRAHGVQADGTVNLLQALLNRGSEGNELPKTRARSELMQQALDALLGKRAD